MKTFISTKNKISQIKEQIALLEKRLKEEELNLYEEITNLLISSKFMIAKYGGYSREYIFCSTLIPNEPWYINGVKITERNKLEIGKICIRELEGAKEYLSIEPGMFFKKVQSINENFESYDNGIVKECCLYKPILTSELSDKIKSVGYCRLSQGGSKNGYDRQITLIKNAAKDDYEIKDFFKETLKGDIPVKNRKAIKDLLEYCQINDVKTIFISELNRLGRTESVILDGIGYLRKNNIEEIHVLRENIIIDKEYILKKYKELKLLAKKCEDDRLNIEYRLKSGYKAFMEKVDKGGLRVGRPLNYKKPDEKYFTEYAKEIDLLEHGFSLRKVHAVTGTSIGTLRKVHAIFKQHNVPTKKDQELTLESVN